MKYAPVIQITPGMRAEKEKSKSKGKAEKQSQSDPFYSKIITPEGVVLSGCCAYTYRTKLAGGPTAMITKCVDDAVANFLNELGKKQA